MSTKAVLERVSVQAPVGSSEFQEVADIHGDCARKLGYSSPIDRRVGGRKLAQTLFDLQIPVFSPSSVKAYQAEMKDEKSRLLKKEDCPVLILTFVVCLFLGVL